LFEVEAVFVKMTNFPKIGSLFLPQLPEVLTKVCLGWPLTLHFASLNVPEV